MSEFLLSIDCSSGWTCLGLAENGDGAGELNLRTGRRQSELLPVLVSFFLETFSLKVSEISLFAVAAGPGSFTGIKVGIAFTQFLAWAEGKKVVPLSSLEVMALNGTDKEGMVLPLLWAGGGKVYAALYSISGKSIVPEETFPEGVYSPEEISRRLDSLNASHTIQWITDTPGKMKGLFRDRLSAGLRRGVPRGIEAVELAWNRRAEACSAKELKARYLRNPDIG